MRPPTPPHSRRHRIGERCFGELARVRRIAGTDGGSCGRALGSRVVEHHERKLVLVAVVGSGITLDGHFAPVVHGLVQAHVRPAVREPLVAEVRHDRVRGVAEHLDTGYQTTLEPVLPRDRVVVDLVGRCGRQVARAQPVPDGHASTRSANSS